MALGWPERQREALDRQSLTGESAPAHRHAARLLAGRNLVVTRVVRVDADGVLFVSADDRPMTAWLERVGGVTRVFVEPGFPPWRTDAARERPPGQDEDGDLGDVSGPFAG